VSVLQRLKYLAASGGWRLMRDTLRLDPLLPPVPEGAIVFACLHRDILPALLYVRTLKPVLVVSNSPDGDLLVHALGDEDFSYVRGATGDGGSRVFVALRRLVENGAHAGLAVDGPRGPFGVVHDGVLQLARLTGRPIVPLRCRCRVSSSLRTWDHAAIPWPGSRVEIRQGPALLVPRDASLEDLADTRNRLAAWLLDSKWEQS